MQIESNVFNFSVKVWLTSVITTPILGILIADYGHWDSNLFFDFTFLFFLIVLGFLFSLPSAVFFYLLTKTINRQGWGLILKKMILVVVGIILLVSPFYILEGVGVMRPPFNASLKVVLLYAVTIIAGIVIYRLGPKKQKIGLKVFVANKE